MNLKKLFRLLTVLHQVKCNANSDTITQNVLQVCIISGVVITNLRVSGRVTESQ
jgi:hypothetical protein